MSRRVPFGSLWPAALLGVGLVGTLDEVLLHQLLGWHHFYDLSTRSVGLFSDGLFHVASTAALAVGLVGVVRRSLPGRELAAGVLVGAGAFNLYDGVVQHKLLGLHQVRRGVANTLPYDAAFVGVAVLLLAAGLWLRRRPR